MVPEILAEQMLIGNPSELKAVELIPQRQHDQNTNRQ